ncbi:hypothetical protein F5Y11DRAFT_366063 [Daldinia sp. FL1419]|nr:hypothetical protein F5Y11DRAFT_366063 [Daldinia sp. FL1419]
MSFPREFTKDDRPVSPRTNRFPDLDPWSHYINQDGNAVKFPDPLPYSSPAEPSEVALQQDTKKFLALEELGILTYNDLSSNNLPGREPPKYTKELSIRQRRQLRLFVDNLDQPIAILLPRKGDYYDSELLISNIKKERPLVNNLKEEGTGSRVVQTILEYGKLHNTDEASATLTGCTHSATQISDYQEATISPESQVQSQEEPVSMADRDFVSGNPTEHSDDDPHGIDAYLASIKDPEQRNKTILAGFNTMLPSNHEFNNVWRHPYYRGEEEDGDYESWFEKAAYEYGWGNDNPFYEPEEDEHWREVSEPKIGDEGIPDQAALNYVLNMREMRERLEAAIRRKREVWKEKYGSDEYDSYAATFTGGPPAGSSSHAKESTPPTQRRIRIKFVKKTIEEEDNVIIPTTRLDNAHGTVTQSSPDKSSASTPRRNNRGRGRGRRRGRGRPRDSKRKANDDSDYFPDDEDSDALNIPRKRRRTA